MASSRAVRLGVVAAFAALLLYSTHSVGRSGSRELLEEASEGDDDGPQLAGASLVGGGVGSGGSSKEASLAVQPPVRRKYGLSDGEIEAAVLAGSQQHGEVSKAGPLPADFWTADKRPWREEVFNAMVARGGCWLAECQRAACLLAAPGRHRAPGVGCAAEEGALTNCLPLGSPPPPSPHHTRSRRGSLFHLLGCPAGLPLLTHASPPVARCAPACRHGPAAQLRVLGIGCDG